MDSSRILIALSCLALASAPACVSTPVLAPNDGQILVSASPPSIVLDEFATPVVDVGSSVVTAQVFNMSGIPQANVPSRDRRSQPVAHAADHQSLIPLTTRRNAMTVRTLR